MTSFIKTKLKDKLEVKHGFAFLGEYFSDNGKYIILTPGNFHEEGGFKFEAKKAKYYKGDFPNNYITKKGDLVVAMTEQAPGLLGSSAFVPTNDKFLHNQRIGLIDLDNKKLDKVFTYYLFNTKGLRRQLQLSSTGTKVKHTSPKRIYDVEVFIPEDINYQKKIAHVLSTLDSKIELNNKINSELEKMAKTLYNYWFVQFDFPDENGKPYKSSGGKMVYNEELKREIPEGWGVERMNNYVNIGSGFPFNSDNYNKSGKYKIVTIKNVQDGYLTTDKIDKINNIPDNIQDFCKLEKGDILMSLTGNVGRMCFVDQKNLLLNQRVGKLIGEKEYINFIYLFFKRPENRKKLEQIAGGSGQANLSPIDAVKIKIFFPEKNILKYFNKEINPIFNLIIKNNIENQKLEELRDWLLPMLMNGQVSVK